MKKSEEELVKKVLAKQFVTGVFQKALIVTHIGVFHGFSITDMDEDYIFGIPQEEIKKMLTDKSSVTYWRIPKSAIIEIYFPDYSEIKDFK